MTFQSQQPIEQEKESLQKKPNIVIIHKNNV